MLTEMFCSSEYKLINLLLKDLGTKLLYPLLQHTEQTKSLRNDRRAFDKAQEK